MNNPPERDTLEAVVSAILAEHIVLRPDDDGLGFYVAGLDTATAAILATLQANLSQVTGERDEALRECSKWATEAGFAKGRLEMSEAAGIVDGWKDRATQAEARLSDALACERLKDEALRLAVDFIEEEADNRSAAGSEHSDYEREPRELAERIRQALEGAKP